MTFWSNEKLHPIQYYRELPSKSDNNLISLLVFKEARGNIEMDGVCLSLYIFWGKCVYFSILELWNSQFCQKNSFGTFIFQKLKSKNTSLKKYTNWAQLTEQNWYNFLSFWENERRKKNKYFTHMSLFGRAKCTLNFYPEEGIVCAKEKEYMAKILLSYFIYTMFLRCSLDFIYLACSPLWLFILQRLFRFSSHAW